MARVDSSTAGASRAPRYLYKKPATEPNAVSRGEHQTELDGESHSPLGGYRGERARIRAMRSADRVR